MEPMATREVLELIAVPVVTFLCVWAAIGLVLWFKPRLWDISKDAAQSPPLAEEDMFLSKRVSHRSAVSSNG